MVRRPESPSNDAVPRPVLARVPGWAWMIACATFFCLMGGLVRELTSGRSVSIFWVGWMRFVVGLLSMALPAAFGAWSLRVRNWYAFAMRGLVGSIGMFLLFSAIAYVGLGRGTVLSYLMGVVGMIAGVFILKEKPTLTVVWAVLAGTVGVLLSCQAGFPRGPEWLGLAAALFSGTTLAYIRLMRKSDTNQVTFFSQGVFGTLLFAVPALCAPAPVGLVTWLLILLMSALDIAGQLCMTQGYAMLPVARGAALMMLTPVLSLTAGVALFQEALTPLQWAGCALVLVSSFVAARGAGGIVRRGKRRGLPK